MRKGKNFIARWGLKIFKMLNTKILCLFNFRTRGVRVFCVAGLPDQMLPGYCMCICASEEEYGGLMVTGEICIAISVSCDFSVD